MLRLSSLLDPSLTYACSPFSAEGLITKVRSGHHRQFLSTTECTVGLTDQMDLEQ